MRCCKLFIINFAWSILHTTKGSLQHHKGETLEGVLVSTLNRVEFLLVFVTWRSIQSRVLNIILLSRQGNIDRQVKVHNEATTHRQEHIAVTVGKKIHCIVGDGAKIE